MAEHQLEWQDPKVQAYKDAYDAKNPFVYADVKDVADHVDHIAKIAGIETVGLGSDFDGVGDTLPTNLKDASMFPKLIEELLRRGYSEADIEKICSGNVMRVWEKVELVAKHLGGTSEQTQEILHRCWRACCSERSGPCLWLVRRSAQA